MPGIPGHPPALGRGEVAPTVSRSRPAPLTRQPRLVLATAELPNRSTCLTGPIRPHTSLVPQSGLRHPRHLRLPGSGHGLFQICFVDVGADEADAEPRARDGRAAEPGERVHRDLNPLQSMESQALLGQPRGEGGRVGPVAVAALDGLVRNEPRVATTPDAFSRRTPTADVRLVLIRHPDRQAVEAGRSLWRQMKD